MILKLFMMVISLALVGETDDEGDNKDANVDPEKSVHFEGFLSLRCDQRFLTWVAAREEQCPRAHEEV